MWPRLLHAPQGKPISHEAYCITKRSTTTVATVCITRRVYPTVPTTSTWTSLFQSVMPPPDVPTSQTNVALCSLVTLKITRVILWLGIQFTPYLSLKPADTSWFRLSTNAMVSVFNFKFTPVKVKPDDKLKYQLKEALMVSSISLVRFLWNTRETSDCGTVRIGKGSFQVSWLPSVK